MAVARPQRSLAAHRYPGAHQTDGVNGAWMCGICRRGWEPTVAVGTETSLTLSCERGTRIPSGLFPNHYMGARMLHQLFRQGTNQGRLQYASYDAK